MLTEIFKKLYIFRFEMKQQITFRFDFSLRYPIMYIIDCQTIERIILELSSPIDISIVSNVKRCHFSTFIFFNIYF
ncbi:hypothetical protein T4D_6328 [Trichinella pseudospiralis]|uniref:Uncharacterized protein n=1 Tax=Trichinella pseudospiralis TaxID=6337 RepID=A0A0V1G5U7_TRIPS|nr:hypothetical protein T4D_6328 [Trichinella pseudospiralis]